MLQVLTVIGARPQFIKAAVVSHALSQRADVCESIVHTGQHYDQNMSEVFFAELSIPKPAHNLEIGSGPHGEQTGRMLAGIERVIQEQPPDVVLVYGDTNSTLAAALAAAKLHVPVAHVEAGLRSFNRRMPEEINRLMTDHLSSLLFTPTQTATRNLTREGIDSALIFEVGDVMYDIALRMAPLADSRTEVQSSLGLERGKYILATIHRAENTDDPDRLKNIIHALQELAKEQPVVLPLHPRTQNALKTLGLDIASTTRGIRVTDPVGYLDMVALERGAQLILTDSGGVQKEAYFHKVPCVTIREETEWLELVDAGWNTLAPPTSASAIVVAAEQAMTAKSRGSEKLYGDGESASDIAELLVDHYRPRSRSADKR